MIEHRDFQNKDWEERWKVGNTRWDTGRVDPALRELIEEKNFELAKGNGFVPGCGRGYDVFYLAQKGYTVTGLDVSETACKTASDLRDSLGINEDQAKFIAEDFYTFKVPDAKYQVVYDYQFFTAMKPVLRGKWGERCAELVSKGGHLITLMYPFAYKDATPPYPITEEAYHEVLDANFDLVHIDRNPKKEPPRMDKNAIAVWKRK
ncbi:hypothetical protein BB559_006923 [Furculomyces boomerangus]|uniref:Thiopurine S-methyltransferase n=1 Tax=Furculomyces boomerangus TaxID=61424 RepID=A0A2T9XZY6_9FUNG|nr:hypothetical protein BB559_006923 [Furculomyces boomerangus]